MADQVMTVPVGELIRMLEALDPEIPVAVADVYGIHAVALEENDVTGEQRCSIMLNGPPRKRAEMPPDRTSVTRRPR